MADDTVTGDDQAGAVFADHELEPSRGAAVRGTGAAGGVAEPGRGAVLSPSTSLGPSERVIPSWTDATVRRASDLIGGPLGVHAQVGRNRILTPLRVCLLMAIGVLICGWLYKSGCIQQAPGAGGVMQLDQAGQRPWIAACYNDPVALYASHGLNTQQLPYATSWLDNGQVQYMEYPVVTGYWMWGVSWLSRWYRDFAGQVGLPVPLDVAAYFTIGAILLGIVYLAAVSFTARIARRRVWDTALMCLSPLLIVHAFTNWDLLAVGITAAAMWAWSRGRWETGGWEKWVVLSGALIGLGAAAKLYPALLLGPLLVLCLRARRMPAWWMAAISAAAVWLVINIPVMLAYPDGWYQFIKTNTQRPAEYDTWYAIYTTLSGSTVFSASPGTTSPHLLNVLSLVLFLLACVAIGWFALATARRPRFAQLAFLVVAAFLLTNKVWSPQYSLWLLPLVALSLPRWRPVLAWQFSEAAAWILLMLTFDSDAGKNLSIYPFIGMALIRDALLITLVVMVIREILRPQNDLIRMAGDDDPSGGVLADADDRVVSWVPNLLRRRPSAVEGPEPADQPSATSVPVPALAGPGELPAPAGRPAAGNGPVPSEGNGS